MPNSFYDLPLTLVCFALIAGFTAAAFAGLLVVRKVLLPKLRVRIEDSEFIGTMVQAIMVFYGLAVALIAVSVWQTYSEAGSLVSQEAACIMALYRDVSLYPEPQRPALQKDVKDYLQFIIKDVWPSQRKGRTLAAPPELVRRMIRDFMGFEPATEQQKLQHGEALRALNEAIKATRLRVDAALGGLPSVLWFVVFAGAFLGISSTFFFNVADFRLHAILVSLLAAFIGLVTFMIFALDHPFRGELGISAEPYEIVDRLVTKP
jgi:hypothetical protein